METLMRPALLPVLSIAIAIVACKSPAPVATAEPTASATATVAPPPAPEKNPKQLRREKVDAAPNLQAALAIIKPAMADEAQEFCDGTFLMAAWALQHPHIEAFSVAKPETSHQLVAKDSDAERGKRVCVAGSLIEIKKEKTPDGNLFIGELMAGDSSIWHFVAAGSTGALVASSPARICGVVIGKYDYAGSASNTVHATEIVGVFDLPENKTASK
jgi:hypothetical protein